MRDGSRAVEDPFPGANERTDSELAGALKETIVESETSAILCAAGQSLVTSREDLRQADIVRHRLFGAGVEPARLGRYTLLGRLGEGAMGVVYSAYDDQLDRKLAVKVIRSRQGHRAEAARLFGEAQAMAKLSHPNVVQIYEVGTVEEDVYIAMEFVRGVTLRAWVENEHHSWRAIVSMFVQAGRGLAAAHDADLVHRDFKADNVLVGEDMRARVTDFGLARRLGPSRPDAQDERFGRGPDDEPIIERSPTDPRLTSTGAILGTPAYMAPEQHRGESADTRSDQFAFCLALYEALYGERPFPGSTRFELAEATSAGVIRPAPAASVVPLRVRRLVVRGLTPRAEERHGSMTALLDALEQTSGQSYGRWLVPGVALATVAGAFVWQVLPDPPEPPQPCALADHAFDESWNPTVRDELSAALAAGSLGYAVDYAKDTAERVTAIFDEYAATWRASAIDACLATHVRLTQSTELMDQRVACLERRRQRFHAAVDVLQSAGSEAMKGAVSAAESLPRVAPCADVERLNIWPDRGHDVDTEVLASVRSDIDRALQLQVIADYARAREAAELALARARGLDDGPLIAEATHVLGKVMAWSVDQRRGVELLLDAADLAEGSQHDELLADVWADLVAFSRGPLADATRGEQWLRRAKATSERLGSPAARQLALRMEEGGLLALAGEFASAEAVLREVIDRVEANESTAPLFGEAAKLLANVRTLAGDKEAALSTYARARVHFARRLGPMHPQVADILQNEAVILSELGRASQAFERFDRAEKIFTAAYGPDSYDHGYLAHARSSVEQGAGRLDAALASATRADEIFRARLGPGHVRLADTAYAIGAIRLSQGEYATALAIFQRALDIAERRPAATQGFRSLHKSGIGESLLGLGRAQEALGHFETALRELEQSPDIDSAFLITANKGRGIALLDLGP